MGVLTNDEHAQRDKVKGSGVGVDTYLGSCLYLARHQLVSLILVRFVVRFAAGARLLHGHGEPVLRGTKAGY